MRTDSATPRVRRRHLAAGILIFVAMTLVLVSISGDVVSHEPFGPWTVAGDLAGPWLRAHGSPGLTGAMRVATTFGSPLAVTGVAVLLALHMWRRRRPYWLAALAWSVFGGALLNRLLKEAVHRARPVVHDPMLTVTGYSFPSGHTMMAAVLYGVFAAYVCAHTRNRHLRVFTVVAASLLIALVGVSRAYLGAHYLSDVLGATAEAFAWLSLSLTAVYSIWQRSNPNRTKSERLFASPGGHAPQR
jgi:membrane-associated phospholipid phosphatase